MEVHVYYTQLQDLQRDNLITINIYMYPICFKHILPVDFNGNEKLYTNKSFNVAITDLLDPQFIEDSNFHVY